MNKVTRDDILVSASHLPHNMTYFFIGLYEGNLSLAAAFLDCESLRLTKFDGACRYPMPKDDWTTLRAYAVKENIPTDFFVEDPYSFVVDLQKMAPFREQFLKRVNAWQAALREGGNQ